METVYLLPLTVVFLTAAVAALGVRAKRRRGYGPLVLGIVAAFAMILGKFAIDSNIAVYAGLVVLVSASVWNSWTSKPIASVPPAPDGPLLQIGSIKRREENGNET